VSLKSQDVAYRPLRPAIAAFFARLGEPLPDAYASVDVRNSRGEQVGDLVART